MTRRLREHPRLVSAQLAVAAVGLAVALLVGSALAGDNRDRETRLEQRLAQASDRQRHQADQLARTQAKLDRTEAELDQLIGQLATRERTALRRASAGRGLRRELAAARRALRRARAP